ncbi:MAG: hypothetical protein QS2022_3550 [Candidatus Phytoplasma asteris]|uniref:Predicted membrane protein n=1 Tax='Chrysanthemum coronarium' phytoplasma TaxID=1520703 RepID=A0ABQ0J258_9MOLU|nr:hypothetical protein ['Chrysanthemum coronarium' phytoplasma]TKA88105.1 MAG: hypothetical protein PLY_3540 [Periwinkle leaf yellowing phytoplasma]WEX19607.1 MAG: hypothetical protein QS2022_3550 [Candidatus Phytoplasma asteris]GAK73654.1 predicted membrane protein ['Chrysanthemum coronarium' phytoplasma]
MQHFQNNYVPPKKMSNQTFWLWIVSITTVLLFLFSYLQYETNIQNKKDIKELIEKSQKTN